MGGAAGIAAAFNAPISGVIYMLEEMATYWPMWMTMQAFICSSTAAFTMHLLSHGSFTKATSALLGGYRELGADFHTQDVPFIFVIGVITGFLSVLIVLACKTVYVFRKKFEKRVGAKTGALVNVVFLTILAVATAVFVPLAFSCSENVVRTDGHHRQLSARNEFIEGLDVHRRLMVTTDENMQYTCPNNTHNTMAVYTHSGPEFNIVMLWSYEKQYDRERSHVRGTLPRRRTVHPQTRI
jgi:hypothetical protein